MLEDAAKEDVEVIPAATSGKPEVLFPIGLPDQGLFDWLDLFLEQNGAKYLEISERKVVEWAASSEVYEQRGSYKSSNDQPGLSFGLSRLDDGSVQQMMAAVAPALRRNL